MKRCPITYEIINDNLSYSKKGLHLLSPKLEILHPLALSAKEQQQQALMLAGKMSIQGMQAKLSAQLKIKTGQLQIVEQGGHYILKPQSPDYPELPENEAITMSLAKTVGIEIPLHGMVYSSDNSMTYFIKRFDRYGHTKKLAVEDFAQLTQQSRDTKYNSSMEKVVRVINDYCSFPKMEMLSLFKRTLFNFFVGNEDMHLKNFSLITKNGITKLAPAYDLLNTSIAIKNPKEELALPLNGKKINLTRRDFLDYFAAEKLQLNAKIIAMTMDVFNKTIPTWEGMIRNSFLSNTMQENYLFLLQERCQRLGL